MSALVISYICFRNKPHNLNLLQAGDASRVKQPSLTSLILRATFILSLTESAWMSHSFQVTVS